MRPHTFQKLLDGRTLEEGLREYFRLMSENARQSSPVYPERDGAVSSHNRELEMM